LKPEDLTLSKVKDLLAEAEGKQDKLKEIKENIKEDRIKNLIEHYKYQIKNCRAAIT